MASASQLTAHRAERTSLASGYGPLAALVAAPPAAAATVLLLPGYTGSKEDFAPLIDPIVDAGLAVVAVDLPGQYESPGPADEGEYVPARLGPMLAGVIGALRPGPVILLGHSYGGLVARAAVLAGAEVAGLVLMCSGPARLPAGNRLSMLDASEPVLRKQGIVALQKLREAVDPARRQGAPRTELDELMRRRFLANSEVGLLGMAAGLRGEPDLVDQLADTLRRTNTPCLVTCGQADDAWHPDEQRAMAERLGAPFVPIRDAGHVPNVENPAELLGVLLPTWHTWLADRARRRPPQHL